MDDYADDDYEYDDTDMYEDDYATMQSQFDNVDLPPGVEAPLPWLKDIASSQDVISVTRTASISDLSESKGKATISDLGENKSKLASASHSTVPVESISDEKDEKEESRVMANIQDFKQFDTVDDFSDHHYSRMGFLWEETVSKVTEDVLVSLSLSVILTVVPFLSFDSHQRTGPRKFRKNGKFWKRTYLVSLNLFNYALQ